MNVYLARQPILNKYRKILAYEMLYRYNEENVFKEGMDGTTATKNLIHDIMMNFGFEHITSGKTAFINFTAAVLLTDTPLLLDPYKVVIELLEDIVYTDELIDRLLFLKAQGYTFALDDYVGEKLPQRVLDIVDIIKVDFMLTTPKRRTQIAKYFGKQKTLLAEKVETEKDFEVACREGFTMFQGYLFSKPVIHFRPANDVSMATYSRLMEEIGRQPPDFDRLAQIIEKDVNASYHLIQKVNTLQYFRRNHIPNVKGALLMMGSEDLYRWLLLLLLKGCSDEKTEAAIFLALVRAVFMANLVKLIDEKINKEKAYMIGLFSMIDEQSRDVLQQMAKTNPTFADIIDVFQGKGGLLSDVLEFVVCYEKNQELQYETQINNFLKKYHLKLEQILYIYVEAVAYSDKSLYI